LDELYTKISRFKVVIGSRSTFASEISDKMLPKDLICPNEEPCLCVWLKEYNVKTVKTT